MKRICILLGILFCVNSFAGTTQWYVDDSVYQTTTCTAGDDVTPPTAPAKYGFVFVGWTDENNIYGTWARAITPSPTNPTYPVFYQNGNLILRALGTGSSKIYDSYDQETGIITRRIGVKELKGTELWTYASTSYAKPDALDAYIIINDLDSSNNRIQAISSHLNYDSGIIWVEQGHPNTFGINVNQLHINVANDVLGIEDYSTPQIRQMKQWLAAQYAAGTPVTIYYPLATPTTENYTPNQ